MIYRNNPKLSYRQVWAKSVDPDQTAPVFTVCYSFCIIWRYHTRVESFILNFIVFTVKLVGSDLRTFMLLKTVQELLLYTDMK